MKHHMTEGLMNWLVDWILIYVDLKNPPRGDKVETSFRRTHTRGENDVSSPPKNMQKETEEGAVCC